MYTLNSNLDDLITKWTVNLEKAKTINMSDALIFGVNAARGQMENRIFNQGLDSTGKPLGIYRGKRNYPKPKKLNDPRKLKFATGGARLLTRYERKRVDAGRQVRYKDLEFTGTLRRGIVVIKQTESRVVCAAPSQRNKDIIDGQEKDLNTKIFSLSVSERDFMKQQINAAIKQKYAGLFNS